jgi:hypothetical protein
MIPDKLLINLKIISKIQKNGRISRSYDGIISLESDVFYQSIKRFISNDSRKQAVFEINSVITEGIEILNHILNSKYMNKHYAQTEEFNKNCENLNLIMTEMELAKMGIENLKFTYQVDPNIVSQLDILILKINTMLKDVGHKLVYFQSSLSPQSQPQVIYNEPYKYNDTSTVGIQSESYQNSFHELASIKIEGDLPEEEQYINMENIKD